MKNQRQKSRPDKIQNQAEHHYYLEPDNKKLTFSGTPHIQNDGLLDLFGDPLEGVDSSFKLDSPRPVAIARPEVELDPEEELRRIPCQPLTWREFDNEEKASLYEKDSVLEFCLIPSRRITVDEFRSLSSDEVVDLIGEVWVKEIPLEKKEDDLSKLGQCGKWANQGECKNGHKYARLLQCGREWCGKCRDDKHKEWIAKWPPRIQRWASMGYLVVTIPPGESRWKAEEPSELNRIRRVMIRKLKAMGFSCGLSRWHYFSNKNPGVFHPHLNLLFEAAYLSPGQIRALKRSALRALADGDPALLDRKLDLHYSYARSPKWMIRWLKYVTKPTFLDWQWNERLAVKLYRFHNSHVWGKRKDWSGIFRDDEPAWELPKRVKEEYQGEEAIAHNTCPKYGEKVIWRVRERDDDWIFRSRELPYRGYRHMWGRYYAHSPPEGGCAKLPPDYLSVMRTTV